MNRIIAIGDIHGCYNTLMSLLEKLQINYDEDKVIFLGDYIDRGREPLLCLKYVRYLAAKYPEAVTVLKGNHEDMLVRYYLENDPCWTWNGSNITMKQFNALDENEQESYIRWCRNLPEEYAINGYKFTHSGYCKNGIDHYGYSKRLWDRNWMQYNLPNKEENDDSFVIFGHTPLTEPWSTEDSLGIDTGACFGKKLTAAVITKENTIQMIQVDSDRKDIINK